MAENAPAAPGNLPVELTKMVGRRAESAAVKRALSASRLVTLVGTGGVGKTRLAVHVARQVQARFPDGVWLVPLAELTQPDLLALTVMSTLTRPALAGTGIAELIDHIGDQRVLLMLDNCEHLAEACAKLTAELLRHCPNLRVLATSREPLRIDGERLLSVPPLSLPPPGRPADSGRLSRYDAIALFLDRARTHAPDLTLSPAAEQAVVALCQRLDGLPLAIELAASRLRALPLETLLTRLEEDQFQPLRLGDRAAPARQRTLRATVEHSYRMCGEPARALWARFAVFAGGAYLDAVERVCAGPGLPEHEVEPALTELVDKSVVIFDRERYRMLDTIRHYGLERLRERGEFPARTAHRDYFAALAAETEAGWFGPDQPALVDRVLADQANVRAALEFCLSEAAEHRVGLRMAGALWNFWIGCGLQREGRLWLDRLLAADPDDSRSGEANPERVTALWVDGYLALVDGDHAAGLALLEECHVLASRLGDQATVAHATYIRGLGALLVDRIETALPGLAEGVRLEHGVPGVNPHLATALVNYGLALCYAGQTDRALTALEEARDLCARHGEQWMRSWSLVHLGLVALRDKRVGDALALLREGLIRKRALDDLLGLSVGVEFVAWAALACAKPRAAARLLGAAQALSAPFGAHLAGFRGLLRWHDEQVRRTRELLGARAFIDAFERGRRLSRYQAVVFALAETRPPGGGEAGGDLPLTPRERQIAELIASGKTNREIAAELEVAQRTVDTHVEHILAKLGVDARAQISAQFFAGKEP